jgi:hypothetical protein
MPQRYIAKEPQESHLRRGTGAGDAKEGKDGIGRESGFVALGEPQEGPIYCLIYFPIYLKGVNFRMAPKVLSIAAYQSERVMANVKAFSPRANP